MPDTLQKFDKITRTLKGPNRQDPGMAVGMKLNFTDGCYLM